MARQGSGPTLSPCQGTPLDCPRCWPAHHLSFLALLTHRPVPGLNRSLSGLAVPAGRGMQPSTRLQPRTGGDMACIRTPLAFRSPVALRVLHRGDLHEGPPPRGTRPATCPPRRGRSGCPRFPASRLVAPSSTHLLYLSNAAFQEVCPLPRDLGGSRSIGPTTDAVREILVNRPLDR